MTDLKTFQYFTPSFVVQEMGKYPPKTTDAFHARVSHLRRFLSYLVLRTLCCVWILYLVLRTFVLVRNVPCLCPQNHFFLANPHSTMLTRRLKASQCWQRQFSSGFNLCFAGITSGLMPFTSYASR